MSTITTKDSTQLYYRDWGKGQPVVFSHGWPLTGDAFEDQMFFLASHGYRCIAHDRRGHGRSSQPWNGNHMEFGGKVMSQHISGRIDVLPQSVRVEVDLPMLLAMFAKKFIPQVEAEGRKMLEKK